MALKNFLYALNLIPFCLLGQNNQTVKEVVTVKRVITNNGQNITISEQQSTQQIKGTVVVAGDSVVNQSATERSIRINDTINAQDQRIKDSVNQAKVAALKAAREAELKASIEAQKAKSRSAEKSSRSAVQKTNRSPGSSAQSTDEKAG